MGIKDIIEEVRLFGLAIVITKALFDAVSVVFGFFLLFRDLPSLRIYWFGAKVPGVIYFIYLFTV